MFLDSASRISIYYIHRWKCGTPNEILNSNQILLEKYERVKWWNKIISSNTSLDNFEPCIFSLLKLCLFHKTNMYQILHEKHGQMTQFNVFGFGVPHLHLLYYNRWRCGRPNEILTSNQYIVPFWTTHFFSLEIMLIPKS